MAIFAANPAVMFLASRVLGIIKQLNYVSHMCVLQLHYSGELLAWFNLLFPLLRFDFLPVEWIYSEVFQIDSTQDSAKSYGFQQVGYTSTMIFLNLGSLLIYQIVIWVLLALCKVIITLGKKSL